MTLKIEVGQKATPIEDARQVSNETADADRPLEPQTEGTHIHAALLAQDATGRSRTTRIWRPTSLPTTISPLPS